MLVVCFSQHTSITHVKDARTARVRCEALTKKYNVIFFDTKLRILN